MTTTTHELPCAKVIELVTVQRRSEQDLWNAIARIAEFMQCQQLTITKIDRKLNYMIAASALMIGTSWTTLAILMML